MELVKRIALAVVLCVVTHAAHAQDTSVTIYIATTQTAGGAANNRFVYYNFTTTNGGEGNVQIGQVFPGTYAQQFTTVRLYGWQPMTAGFWYRRVIVDTSTGTVVNITDWERGSLSIMVGSQNNLEVTVQLESGFTVHPIADFASAPAFVDPATNPDAWGRIEFDPEAAPEDIAFSSHADSYLYVRLNNVQTAGFLGGTGGGGIDLGGGEPGDGELPDGAKYSFENPNTGGLNAGTSGWLFDVPIKQMEGIVLDEGGRNYVASVSDGFNGVFFSAEWDFSWYVNSDFKAVGDAVMLGFAGWWALLLPINALKKR